MAETHFYLGLLVIKTGRYWDSRGMGGEAGQGCEGRPGRDGRDRLPRLQMGEPARLVVSSQRQEGRTLMAGKDDLTSPGWGWHSQDPVTVAWHRGRGAQERGA